MKLSDAAAGAAQSRDGTGLDAMPAVLLVEDDPTTLAYLVAITAALPVRVDTATCLADALALARSRPYALWLVDAHLPDGAGRELLGLRRGRTGWPPALAHTAAREPRECTALLEAGFADVLVKPVTATRWQAAIRRHLADPLSASPTSAPAPPPPDTLLWDDDAATTALGGNPAHVDALRGLFLSELPALLEALRIGPGALRDGALHRLRASCAFVGAARLAAAVRDLQDAPQCEVRLQQVIGIAHASLAQKAPK